MEGYTPQVKKPEMEYQFGLPLDEWMSKYGNKHSQRFIPQRQDDGTTKWTVRYIFNQHMRMVWDSNDLFSSGMQQQLPLRPSTAVPAHGTPLSRAAQPPHQSPASAQPTPTPAPTSSEPSNGPKRRTLEEIDAEEEEMDRQVAARREGFREERRRLFEEGSGAF